MVVNSLREWRLLCPKGALCLVFPSGAGNVESHSNVAQRGLEPILRKAGIVVLEDGFDNDGKPVKIEKPKYGLHSLRHAAASLWIENGTNAKRIQTLMGHSSITLTYDRYGHWFADDAADQKAAEDIQFRLLGK
jgi:integrase